MKKYIFIVLFFIKGTGIVFCQQITFQKYYVDSTNNFIWPYELLQTNDHGYLTGNVKSLVKTDSLGQMEWYKQYTFTGFNSVAFYCNDKTFDDGYITTGYRMLLKLDSNYTIIWKREFVNLTSAAFYTIRETNDHGFILGGTLDLNPGYDFFLVKTDSTGVVQWSKIYHSPLGSSSLQFLTIAEDGGYLLCGRAFSIFDTTSLRSDIRLVKVDSLGNPQWVKHYNSIIPDEIYCYHIVAVSDGNYVLAGSRNLNKFILKIDSIGTILWEKLYDDPVSANITWIEETKDHGLIATGIYGGSFAQLFKTDNAGNLLWARRYLAGARGACVKETDDGGFAMAAVGSDNGFSGIYLIKTDSLGRTNGCLEDTLIITVSSILTDSVINYTVTDSNLNVTSIPSAINPTGSGWAFTNCPPVVSVPETSEKNTEIEIFPNPVADKLTITTNNNDFSEIILYDITSQKLLQQKFTNTVTLNTSQLAKGMYLYEVKNKKGVVKKGKVVKE